MKKILLHKDGYKWKYFSMGGAVRIAIETGEDIAHLPELDKKLWTVLSCPTSGLEFNGRALQLLDTDNDGKIKVNEVIEAATWLTSVVKDPDTIVEGSESIRIEDFNTDNDQGALLARSSVELLKALGREKDEISISDVADYIAGIDLKCSQAKEAAAAGEALSAPYGEKSDAAVEAVAAVRSKIDDYFIRCSLIDFDEECSAALDVSVERIAAIGGDNLTQCTGQIESYPLSRPSREAMLQIDKGINPVWQERFAKFKEIVLDTDFPGATSISKAQWTEVTARIDAYVERKNAIAGMSAEVLDKSLAAERAFVAPVERFIYLNRYFYDFLNNFVSFKYFYIKDKRAVFQAGTLYIDRRACELCIKVSEMGRHGDMANLSGMYLIYCDCRSVGKSETMQIVAVMTEGPVGQIRVGKNAIFYDRKGGEWDAVVTKVIDNPISIRQAMWSPYRKFGNWCSAQIEKMASDKEAKTFSSLQESATKAGDEVVTVAKEGASTKKQAFDIAKFCGIFAAIGMALGYIGSFCVSVFTGFIALKWWQMPLSILAVMLVISGPSMIIAWSKLRRRNLGPVLNANGWAINSLVLVNVNFGSHLTHMSSYPKLNLYDPYQPKGMPKWKKWLIAIAILLLILAFAVFAFLFKSYTASV